MDAFHTVLDYFETTVESCWEWEFGWNKMLEKLVGPVR